MQVSPEDEQSTLFKTSFKRDFTHGCTCNFTIHIIFKVTRMQVGQTEVSFLCIFQSCQHIICILQLKRFRTTIKEIFRITFNIMGKKFSYKSERFCS